MAKQTNMKMQNMAPKVNISRSTFDRSHGYKTMFDSGYLIPFYVDLAMPGDTFKLRANLFARLQSQIVPFMDNLKLTTFFFACPWRLLWTNFPKFMGEQLNPGDSTTYLIPQVQSPASGFAVGTLYDYFGIPTVGQTAAGKKITVNNLHARMYNLTWNQWFRDENLQNSLTVDLGDGPDTAASYVIKRRGKRPDYLTTCLPWPQKGTAVQLPLGGSANIILSAAGGTYPTTAVPKVVRRDLGLITSVSTALLGYPLGGVNTFGDDTVGIQIVPNGAWVADLTTATGATINEFRSAMQVQSMYEKDARGGTRYTELIQSHFGVTSPDARLQRVEYLGGGSTYVRVNPVAQSQATGASGTTTPQGNLASFALAQASGHGFSKSFTEHMCLMGLIHVGADLSYQQGLEKMWTYQTRHDLYWPSLAHLGEQAVLNREIYATDDTLAAETEVFGYQERYAELRFKYSLITGKMRSTAASTLDVWHLSQKFTSLPTLGNDFISDTPPVARVIAVPGQPEFFLDCHISLQCARPMPVYGNPAELSRF